jgi:hypothetical protein
MKRGSLYTSVYPTAFRSKAGSTFLINRVGLYSEGLRRFQESSEPHGRLTETSSGQVIPKEDIHGLNQPHDTMSSHGSSRCAGRVWPSVRVGGQADQADRTGCRMPMKSPEPHGRLTEMMVASLQAGSPNNIHSQSKTS